MDSGTDNCTGETQKSISRTPTTPCSLPVSLLSVSKR